MSRWQKKLLGGLVDILSGFAFASEQFSDSGDMPIVRIRDVLPGRSSTFYRGEYDPKYVLRDGDVLIGMDGEFNRARWQGGSALLNQRVCRIAASNGGLDNDYLFHFLPAALKAIEDVTPFVTVKHLSVKTIREIEIPVPPLAEQRRIAKVLDRAEALRAKRRAAIAQLDSLTQSVFLDLFSDPMKPCKRWQTSTFGELVTHLAYGPRFYNEAYSPNGIRIVRITDLDEAGALNFETMPRMAVDAKDEQNYALQRGDVLFARSGSVGKSAVFPRNAPRCIAGAYFIVMRFKPVVTSLFARSVLNAPSIRNFIQVRSRQAIQPNFSGPGLRALPLPLPPIELQREFDRRVTAVEKVKTAQRASLAKLDALFAALQHRAFRGEL